MSILGDGGFTFAEDPAVSAPYARLVWVADLDPGTLEVRVRPPASPSDDIADLAVLAPWITAVADLEGRQHVVLADGWHRIRIDVAEGSLVGQGGVDLEVRVVGIASGGRKLMPMRRLFALCRSGRIASALFPRDPRIDRWLAMLRVHDALGEGASQREVAIALFGRERVTEAWGGASDSLQSRVRRLIAGARAMAAGGYRRLMLGGLDRD